MLGLTNVALAALSLFSLSAKAAPTPITERDVQRQVNFTNTFPDAYCVGQEYDFSWIGGSGLYNLQATLIFDGQFSAHPAYFLWMSADQGYTFKVDSLDPSKPNSQYAFVIQDYNNVTSSDSTGFIPLVEC